MEDYYDRSSFRSHSESKHWERKNCHTGLVAGQGRPHTGSCWGAVADWACSPSLADGGELVHAPHRDVKMGILFPIIIPKHYTLIIPKHKMKNTPLSSPDLYMELYLASSLRGTDIPLHPKTYFLQSYRPWWSQYLPNHLDYKFKLFLLYCNLRNNFFWVASTALRDKMKALLSSFSTLSDLKRQPQNSALKISLATEPL